MKHILQFYFLILLLLAPATGYAAIAYDAFNAGAAGTGTLSWTHTPVGTPAGALVVCGYISTADQITTVTYGGDAMTEVDLSPLTKLANESGTIHAFFLGTSIPTGAQTVEVTVDDITTKRCSSYTMTAADDTSVATTDTFTSDSQDDPSDTLVTADGLETFIVGIILSGFDSVGTVTGGSGYTTTGNSDIGTMSFHQMRRTTNATGGNVTYSWATSSAEDVIMMGIAMREGVGGGQPPRSMHQFRLRRQ